MTSETVAVHLPQSLYRRLERLAELTHRPLENLVVQTLSSTIPPLPEDLPDTVRDALVALEPLRDDELWHVTRSAIAEEQYAQFVLLREKERIGNITEAERDILTRLRQEAGLILRKAYAAVLLKWRGHRLPPLDELEARS